MIINLPTPPQRYEPAAFMSILDTLKRALTFAISKREAADGILLQDADGAVWKVTVNTVGTLVVTTVPLGS